MEKIDETPDGPIGFNMNSESSYIPPEPYRPYELPIEDIKQALKNRSNDWCCPPNPNIKNHKAMPIEVPNEQLPIYLQEYIKEKVELGSPIPNTIIDGVLKKHYNLEPMFTDRLLPVEYFTPDISDIRVGYELEWRMPRRDYIKYHDESVYDWQKHTITIYDFNQHDLAEEFHNVAFGGCEFRVPYLTASQIEKEGWEISTKNQYSSYTPYCMFFTKGNYFGGILIDTKRLVIGMKDVLLDRWTEHTSNGQLFYGECKDINTFRYILKLLGI